MDWAFYRIRILTLALAFLSGCGSHRPSLTSPSTPSAVPKTNPKLIVTALFFGMSTAEGIGVSEQQWQHFLDEVITPRFPQGLTVLDAHGQYLPSTSRKVQKEVTKVVLIVHPVNVSNARKIDAIRALYRDHFDQESVLHLKIIGEASF